MLSALEYTLQITSTNVEFKVKKDKDQNETAMYTYSQEKVMTSPIYWKRKVLPDDIHTLNVTLRPQHYIQKLPKPNQPVDDGAAGAEVVPGNPDMDVYNDLGLGGQVVYECEPGGIDFLCSDGGFILYIFICIYPYATTPFLSPLFHASSFALFVVDKTIIGSRR